MRKIVSIPAISIVIPTYNRARDIPRCLDSLIGQDYQNFEVLVCDDGSTDDTKNIVGPYMQFLDITYVYCENFGGPARPRNRGIALARAPYIAFLDSDDWWAPAKLRLSLAVLSAGADIVYHDLYIVTTLQQRTFSKVTGGRALKRPVLDELLAHGNVLDNSSVIVRKELLLEIGYVSEENDLIGIEDYDTWLKISKITDKFERIPSVLGYYWVGGGNISSEDRYIRLIQVIKKRYASEILALEPRFNLYWIQYAEGRYYFKLKRFDLAKQFLSRIDFRRTPLDVYLKTICMLFVMRFKL
jgi:glycosyltransferase involved in cell wall biosynthesis